MSSHDDVPYADPEPMADLLEECRCAEAECEAHGMNLHPEQHVDSKPAPPLVVTDQAQHMVDGYSDYGS